MTVALVSPPLLRWARLRARLDLEYLSQKTHVAPARLASWENGDTRPTFKQAQDLARVLHVPFGYLFLTQPPQESLTIPDFRTIGSSETGALSPELRDVVADTLRRQDWLREYLKEKGADDLPMVGRFRPSDGVKAVAKDIQRVLKLTMEERVQVSGWEALFGLLFERAESEGINVVRSGIVGNNTHRPLLVEDFRGFALSDPLAPFVFVNGADAPSAQLFTLAHKLAHIWLGLSGVGGERLETELPSFLETERFCDAVAAEVLVPLGEIRPRWNSSVTFDENVRVLSRVFHVSPLVVARRAVDLEVVDWSRYHEFYLAEMERFRLSRGGRTGGDYYRTVPARNGRRFTTAVVTKALRRELLWRDAARLLAIQPGQLERLAQEMGIG